MLDFRSNVSCSSPSSSSNAYESRDSNRLAYSEKSTSQKSMRHEKQNGHLNENSLPSILKSSLKRIRACEFINFDLLLSQLLSSPAYSDSQVAYNINFSGNTGLSLHASGPPK